MTCCGITALCVALRGKKCLVVSLLLMAQALRVARTELFIEARPNVTKLAVLITDGRPSREVEDIIPQANLLKAENVEVFCIGITDDVSIIFIQGQ